MLIHSQNEYHVTDRTMFDAPQATDVTSQDIRCYETTSASATGTATVAAGSSLGIQADNSFYHPGVSCFLNS